MVFQCRRRPSPSFPRWFHIASPKHQQLLKQKIPSPSGTWSRKDRPLDQNQREHAEKVTEEPRLSQHVKRNELGVQLLSRQLHSQIFKNVSFPSPEPAYVHISKEHLQMHGLDFTQGSILPDTGFVLPQLQGSNLPEHFHRIGSHVAEPWLNLAKSFASTQLPPKPDDWHIQSGWTKYYYHSDGSSYCEHVPYPMHNGQPEEMLAFDVETMPKHHPYAIMACAASPNGWYSWLSPWLLNETEDPCQLIPFGSPQTPRVIVGHNVSYDRARVQEEYDLKSTMNRFLDTMALHVAVKGISSHQRPAWMKHRKQKRTELEQQKQAIQAVADLKEEAKERHTEEVDIKKKEELESYTLSLPSLEDESNAETAEAELSSKRWEDLTSANSLADVANLHCGIDVDKEIRNDFSTLAPSDIRDNVHDYLAYCANDVDVTHRVYATVLPDFFSNCPHPVSFAGILTMGSSFLTVNQEWESYLHRSESSYRQMEEGVKDKLKDLAEAARLLMDDETQWKTDPWLSQLDWAPKIAGKSRGVTINTVVEDPPCSNNHELETTALTEANPAWYSALQTDPFDKKNMEQVIPLLLSLVYDGHPLLFNRMERWHFVVDGEVRRLPTAKDKKTNAILNPRHAGALLQSGAMSSCDSKLALAICNGDKSEPTIERILALARSALSKANTGAVDSDPCLVQLGQSGLSTRKRTISPRLAKPPPVLWPKWYWELAKPRKNMPPGSLDITVRNRIAPLLLRLSWMSWPLFHSRQHGWTFRVPPDASFDPRSKPLRFDVPADSALADLALCEGYRFYKLPHKDGETANVGSPLSKLFIKYAQDGTLACPGNEAKEALEMNAQCSYWISARDRILNQMVTWQTSQCDLGLPRSNSEGKKWGIILPQVITMGTVTRRAIEKTWLTASNAKNNRVGSELKAMVRAPDGYAIVGADVDSEELWISSCMGDAQFGIHGATALGWMTLEGTKATGTDLHSKTANILGISRNQAKVFNYSRIYGAGKRHAVLLLLQSNAGMLPEAAQKLAKSLYDSTKGQNTNRTDIFNRKFWFGGTESFIFNKLEKIALSDQPRTPALGCGITYALSKEYLPLEYGADYMPSRINWVVQSSGVDYLHLLIVSMDYLISKYGIKARYLISVHDELRYLVEEQDQYRAALALQVANLWTRSFFAYKLGMDDLPQGVAFFSAVDIDKVLRKEVDLPCVTPSQPHVIPPGESLDIVGLLKKTNGGSLRKDGSAMSTEQDAPLGTLEGYVEPDCLVHRAPSAYFLRAQATNDFGEIKCLAQKAFGKKFTGGIGSNTLKARTPKVIVNVSAAEENDFRMEKDRLESHFQS